MAQAEALPALVRPREIVTPGRAEEAVLGAYLRAGFAECFRVLRPFGTLIFKWSEVRVPVSEVLALTPERPVIGHKSGLRSNTHWIAFMKSAGAA